MREQNTQQTPNLPLPAFDSDAYRIGVDNHASFCMANSPHLFENLRLTDRGTQVQGIGEGLQVEGMRTFVMRINDDDGKTHVVKIPKSLYLPKLKGCLLWPQHWAQEAKARKGNKANAWMENYWDKCVHIQDGGKFRRSIPHDPSTNTPTFYSAPASKTYRAFTTTYEACSADFFDRERIAYDPSTGEHAPEEFVAEENINVTTRQKFLTM